MRIPTYIAALLVLLLLNQRSLAESGVQEVTPPATEAAAAAAPGGGEMILLGPDIRYGPRARVDESGRVTVECVDAADADGGEPK